MSALDNIKALLRTNGHVEAQTKETLIKCFEQLLAGTGEITSPAGTITVTPGNPTTVDVTGLPPDDNETNLGTFNRRWENLRLGAGGGVNFDTGSGGATNTIGYADTIGPTFTDRGSGKALVFNVQDLTGNRTATWQDESGTVAWLHNCFTNVIVIAASSGAGITALGVNEASTQHWIFHSAGTMAEYHISADDGTFEGQRMIHSFNNVVTSLTMEGSNWSAAGFAIPTSAAANQAIGWVWSGSAWVRFQ
jgi:hypothetical protein